MNTAHKLTCRMMWGRKDPSCPRCIELLNGAAARDGWQKDYFIRKEKRDQQWTKELKTHDCKTCSPVCTRFDW